MQLTTLAERPDLISQTIDLIEECFDYQEPNHFDIDFAPLFTQDNLMHCHILLTPEDEVIGHIAVKPKKFKFIKWQHPILFIGGICIKKDRQGQKLFSQMFQYVFDLYSHEYALLMLWSDKAALYEKFGFTPAIGQFSFAQNINNHSSFIRTTWDSLTTEHMSQLSALFKNFPAWQCERLEADWDVIKQIQSAELYTIKENNVITHYFIKNKGADLLNIIYECNLEALQEKFNEIIVHGTLWTSILPAGAGVEPEIQYCANVAIGDIALFAKFISSYTNKSVEISKMENEMISFYFEGQEIILPINDFLTGIFGPNTFSELSELPAIRISGIDSI